jgi:hypothetical protein
MITRLRDPVPERVGTGSKSPLGAFGPHSVLPISNLSSNMDELSRLSFSCLQAFSIRSERPTRSQAGRAVRIPFFHQRESFYAGQLRASRKEGRFPGIKAGQLEWAPIRGFYRARGRRTAIEAGYKTAGDLHIVTRPLQGGTVYMTGRNPRIP